MAVSIPFRVIKMSCLIFVLNYIAIAKHIKGSDITSFPIKDLRCEILFKEKVN